ncbi:DUF4350 domain-containing protein [Actinomycetospora lemnae]|uniref:DUF4350 domain-containing protein n=1 Tax=Actinomycetospora lemnae TaxID=3019891 RepID=A0ABT5SP50_9PSEU|nr:DUF4350 domain-containing protein [Actinomycetospora sp. DW7H6]MDD7964618.1 DUF4350 domain-containing protein [Actinomycetospora sp. DW7H6]
MTAGAPGPTSTPVTESPPGAVINGDFRRVEAANRPFAANRGGIRRWRGPVLVVAAVLLGALVIALLGAAPRTGGLDPEAASPEGSMALARLLEGQGVRVEPVADLDAATAARGRTVFVTFPERMSTRQRETLAAAGADLVLVRPDERSLAALAPAVRTELLALPEPTDPACGLPAAVRAGPVDLVGAAYATDDPAAQRCYPVEEPVGASSLVAVRDRGRTVTVVGDAAPFTNDVLDEQGNAALALNLLGAHPDLLWYLPVPPPAEPGQERSTTELLPSGWVWGPVQLLVAGLAVALWRGRRLGPVVTEDLPVVVPAGETVRGRARLYRRAGARDRAAAALRGDAVRDLAARLGVPRGAGTRAVVDAVAARTGRPVGEVGAVLDGPVPADDPALVTLAGDLDALRRGVRDATGPAPRDGRDPAP